MKINNKLLCVLIAGIIVSVVLPLVFRDNSETANQTFIVIATLISSAASLLTLVIAILLFNKFGIEKPLLQKNIDVVFPLLEKFKNTTLFMEKLRGEIFLMQIQANKPMLYNVKRYYDEKLLFSQDAISAFKDLTKMSNSSFMPKSIYLKISKLRVDSFSVVIDNEHPRKYATIDLFENFGKRGTQFGLLNGKDMSLFEFLNILDDIKSELINWIDKNSEYSHDLNF